MKNQGFGAAVLAVLCFLCFGLGSALACPRFVEFFSDPKDVPDQEGEFVEIRLDDCGAESLWVQMDEKPALSFALPRGNSWESGSTFKRFVLVHDSLYCPKGNGVACGLLGKLSLPNSRRSTWRLWAGSCVDSVEIPEPKAGMALQRVKDSDRWIFAEPTIGCANPQYEVGVADCGLAPVLRDRDKYTVFLTGCDSAWLRLERIPLDGSASVIDSLWVVGNFSWESSRDFWIRGNLPPDEAPYNDSLDTLLFAPGGGPLVVSEVHHCPQEPEPEWVEVYNRSAVAVPLEKFRFCGRGGSWGAGVIDPYETIVLTKDTAQLREYLGYRDVGLVQVALGYLNNSSGCISICSGEAVVDSVCWDRHMVSCPSGFNPLTMESENTPGFVRSNGTNEKIQSPFTYKLSSRVVRLGGNSLRVYVESEFQVSLRLLDSAGRERWKADVPPGFNAWRKVSLDGMGLGVAYVSISTGKFENVVGILIRP